ncbi:MAG: bifunctional riboflavin kinase/FAD synthetase [Bacteroidales bacterium]|nr:bifunctional riboflavin kinase/FAD synthetase [Bacteroidales bacterium]MDD4214720.1 bifunctional riboflavin kinase/FAD synthetase [Bacteroidales bacterium]
MRVYNDINSICCDFQTVVSTGTFDGVHSGHRAIIKKMTEIAKDKNLKTVIVTFEPHPRIVLKKDQQKLKLLTSIKEKLKLFEMLGIDDVVLIDFSEQFARTSYESFIKDYLVKRLKSKYITIGFDHRFGEQRSGTQEKLRELGKAYNFDVVEVAPVAINGLVVSSTKIRNLLQDGQTKLAAQLLGYPYMITGKVVKGSQTGQKIGFPTANLAVEEPYKLIPAVGVYGVMVTIGDACYKGMCNIGYKPTFKKNSLSIEVHIFDFQENLYNKELKLNFHFFIRHEKKFESPDLLAKQLISDKELVLKKFYEK